MRIRNYRAASTQKTIAKQAAIRRALALSEDGLTVAEVGRVLGVSRQAALYHVKKLAADGQIVMVLEPCASNRGIRFRVWSEMALAARYARLLTQVSCLGAPRAA
jgi:predicted ArsR family transcriptional regulator